MKCKVYSEQNRCCKLLYDNPFKISMSDIDPNCKGLNTVCAWYHSPYNNEVNIKKQRRDLRQMKHSLGLASEVFNGK